MNAEKTVLLTGGSGFLGGWCIVELLRAGYRVRATLRDPAREAEVRAMLAPQVDAGDRLEIAIADLGADAGWAQAAAGCAGVLHVASPFPRTQPRDPDDLIVPAREGTLRVLRAGLDAGAAHVVVTSSVAAVRHTATPHSGLYTEADWTDATDTKLSPYTRSKAIAEKAAWDHVDQHGVRSQLTTICPGAILGPLLASDPSFSLEAISRLLGGMPGVPRLGFGWIDVRDLAKLHVLALTAPQARAQRILAAGEFLSLADVAAVLKRELGADAAKVPTRVLPDLLIKAGALFDASMRAFVGDLGEKIEFSDEAARSLGWAPRPLDETIVETARSLLALA